MSERRHPEGIGGEGVLTTEKSLASVRSAPFGMGDVRGLTLSIDR